MSDVPSELDLKFLPDWLKEGPKKNQYSDYEGDPGERPRRDSRDRSPRGERAPRDERRKREGTQRDDRRGPRREGARAPQGGRRNERGPDRRQGPPPPRPAAPPVPRVKVEFVPEPNGAANIARQIKSSGRAYPLFGTARLFLERPERHRVRITSLDPAIPLFQIGDGPISFDRAALERNAFHHQQEEFYREETAQGEPIKGNYSNVARCRATGTFLGPTNYHGYQPALRKLYEERFSRRMPFAEFQQHEIEIVTDAQAINDWKEQARSTTTFVTLKEEQPLTFKSSFDAEQHFRKNYLPQLIKSGVTLETSGQASRGIADPQILQALREAWEHERGFPVNLVNRLRPEFAQAGLHFFKHRKRVLYVSPIRPQRHPADQIFSDGITAILGVVEANPKITRPQLAAKLLGDQTDTPDVAAKKELLAADLHYLIRAGHVLEFHDGTLDLPLSPRAEAGLEPHPEGASRRPAAKAEQSASPPVVVAEAESFAAPGPPHTLSAPETITSPEVLTATEELVSSGSSGLPAPSAIGSDPAAVDFLEPSESPSPNPGELASSLPAEFKGGDDIGTTAAFSATSAGELSLHGGELVSEGGAVPTSDVLRAFAEPASEGVIPPSEAAVVTTETEPL